MIQNKDKENLFNSNQNFESKESRRIMLNEPKPTNFHNTKSHKYLESTTTTYKPSSGSSSVIRNSDRPYKLEPAIKPQQKSPNPLKVTKLSNTVLSDSKSTEFLKNLSICKDQKLYTK